MVEFTEGADGYLFTHEWTFFVFESAMILPCIALFNVFHPASFISNIGFRQKRGVDPLLSRSHSEVELHRQQDSYQPPAGPPQPKYAPGGQYLNPNTPAY